MIFVKGYGQMCNNILQYAHLYAFGKEHKVTVVSLRFSYKYRFFEICKKWYHNPLTYILGKLLITFRVITCIKDGSNIIQDQQLCKPWIIASAAWHLRYPDLFLKYRDDIARIFEIKPTIQAKVNCWMNTHPQADINLGLHIRRGDYIRWQGGKYFFSDEVYHRIIKDFIALHPNETINIYICTNDNALNIDGFTAVHPTTFLSEGSAIEDLQLLASCDYLIGVKSTFSLWASFYRRVPLYWIMDKDVPLTAQSFVYFDAVFTTV